MGFKKLSEQELSEHISNADEIIAIINGELKKVSIETLVSLMNKTFDVSVAANTDKEYKLKVNIGETTIITPNLRVASITSIKIVKGHLIFYFSDGTTMDAGIVDASRIPEYGVMRDINSHSPTLTRIGAAANLAANAGVGSDVVRNDFDNIYPWSEMRKCILAEDGTVTAYEGDATYTEDGSLGRVMVEIPKFYLKHYIDEENAKERWYICREQKDGDYRLPQPFYSADGTELDTIYIAAYLSASDKDNKGNSKSGNVHCSKMSYSAALQQAREIGDNWHMVDVAELTDVIQPLFIVEFATLDSQSVMYGQPGCTADMFACISVSENHCFGDGSDPNTTYIGNHFYSFDFTEGLVVGQEIVIGIDAEYVKDEFDYVDKDGAYAVRKVTGVEVVNTDEYGTESLKITFSGTPIEVNENYFAGYSWGRNGATQEIAASSGSVANNVGLCAMHYRGIENLYGFGHTWLNGILAEDGKYFVTDDILKNGTSAEEYTELSFPIPSANGYIRKMGADAAVPWAYVPSETDGASDEDFCDYFQKITSQGNALSCTFGYSSKLQNGLFAFFVYRPVQNAIAQYLRIAYRKYLPDNEGGNA